MHIEQDIAAQRSMLWRRIKLKKRIDKNSLDHILFSFVCVILLFDCFAPDDIKRTNQVSCT
jgi:hypothetical protein